MYKRVATVACHFVTFATGYVTQKITLSPDSLFQQSNHNSQLLLSHVQNPKSCLKDFGKYTVLVV
jgi:hypothetical protein